MYNLAAKRTFAWVDMAKFIGAVLVLWVHARPLAGGPAWLDFSISHIFIRQVVPFFFVAAGFFFAKDFVPGQKLAWRMVWRRLKRILILYLGWTVIYLPMLVYNLSMSGAAAPADLVWRVCQEVAAGFYHLWFFTALLQAMICVAVLSRFLSIERIFAAAVVLFAIATWLGTYRVIPFDWYYNAFVRNGVLFGLCFFVLGMCIRYHAWSFSLSRCLAGLLLGLAALFLEGAFVFCTYGGEPVDMYFSLLPCAFFGFLLLLQAEQRVPGWISGRAKAFRAYSVLIYTSHVLIGMVLFLPSIQELLGVWRFLTVGVPFFLLVLFLAVLLSKVILRLERQVPWLRYLH